MTRLPRYRFTCDDRGGLWNEGDVAEDMGPESDPSTGVRLLRVYMSADDKTGEVISLERPFERGLLEPVSERPA